MYAKKITNCTRKDLDHQSGSVEKADTDSNAIEHNFSNISVTSRVPQNSLQFSKRTPILQLGGGDSDNDEAASSDDDDEQGDEAGAHRFLASRFRNDDSDDDEADDNRQSQLQYELQRSHPFRGSGNCHGFTLSGGRDTSTSRALSHPAAFAENYDPHQHGPITVFMRGDQVAHSAIGHDGNCMHKTGERGPVIKCAADNYAAASGCDRTYKLPNDLDDFTAHAQRVTQSEQRQGRKHQAFLDHCARHADHVSDETRRNRDYQRRFMDLQDLKDDDDVDEGAFAGHIASLEKDFPRE